MISGRGCCTWPAPPSKWSRQWRGVLSGHVQQFPAMVELGGGALALAPSRPKPRLPKERVHVSHTSPVLSRGRPRMRLGGLIYAAPLAGGHLPLCTLT